MNRFTEEHINNYLDQSLTAEQVGELEKAMSHDPELKATVERLQKAHLFLLENQIEVAPEEMADQIMAEVADLSKKPYYRPSGLFSSTSFLLISGILTAVVAFLSLVNTGYIDVHSIAPGITEAALPDQWTLNDLISGRLIKNSMLVIYGVLALALLDRLILNPFFRKKSKHLGLASE